MDPELLAKIREALGTAGNFARQVVDPTQGRGIFGFGAEVARDIQRNPIEALTVVGDVEANLAGQELSREGHPFLGGGLQLLGAGGAAMTAFPVAGSIANVAQRRATGAARSLLRSDIAETGVRAHLPTPQAPTGPPVMARLEHRGPRAGEIDTIDPSFQGTGQPGAERNRLASSPDTFLDRSFFNREGSQIEPRFASQPLAGADVPEHLIARPEDWNQFVEEAVRVQSARGVHNPSEVGNIAEQISVAQGFEAVEPYPGVIQKFTPTPVRAGATGGGVRRVANQAAEYADEARAAGMDIPPTPAEFEYLPLDPQRGARMADVYESLPHAPNDPAVRASYDAFARETRLQYDKLVDDGVEFIPVSENPYDTSAEMIADIRDNNRLKFFETSAGYGSGGPDVPDHPLLGESGIVIDGKPMLHNDLFRAVHDYFGHASEGFQFGPRGEDNAWALHASMFSPEARGAMTMETRGQNSWVNFGRQIRREDGSIPARGDADFIPPADRPYADQKANILPEEFQTIERSGGPPAADPLAGAFVEGTEQFAKGGDSFGIDSGNLSISGRYDPETGVVNIGNVQGGRNEVGTTALRQALRDIRAQFPDATKIEGLRTSEGGLRQGRESSFNLRQAEQEFPEQMPTPDELFSRGSQTVDEFLGDLAGGGRRLPERPATAAEAAHERAKFDRRSAANRQARVEAIESGLNETELAAYRAGNKTLKANVEDAYSRLPTPETFAQAAIRGSESLGWYRGSGQAIREAFGDDGPRFAALLAAQSPQKSVEENLKLALNSWGNWTQAGRPTDDASIRALMDTTLEADLGNSVRALSASDEAVAALDPSLLSGPKVGPFYANLGGAVDPIVNDTHMARGFGTDPGGVGTKGRNLAQNAMIRNAAAEFERITGRAVDPRELQEMSWAYIRGLTNAAGEKGSALEVIEQSFLEPGAAFAGGQEVSERIRNSVSIGHLMADPRFAESLARAGVQAPTPRSPTGLPGVDPQSADINALRDIAERIDLVRSGTPLYSAAPIGLFGIANASQRLDRERQRRR